MEAGMHGLADLLLALLVAPLLLADRVNRRLGTG
jgi:hypothetical protein